jgi:UDP-3-O-[3-hydroxymyristoyl] glucosamine N-acyltransferase
MNFPEPIRVSEIARFIGAEIKGNKEAVANGLNEIHVVRNGDITFVDHPKYYNKVLNSEASVIIINKEVTPPKNKTLLIHSAPFDAFNQLILKYRPFLKAEKLVSDTAQIGKNTVIQPGAFVGHNVVIGDNCIIHANASIYDNSIIGNNVIIHANSVIGADAYYFQRREHGYVKFYSAGRTIIEDDVEIGSLCSIDKGVTGDTVIGKGTKMDNHCQIGHDTRIGKNCLIGAFAAIAGVTVLEDDVILWARVAINKDIVIKKGAVILATSAVDKTLEGDTVYMGSPAIEVRKYWRQFVAMKQIPELLRKLSKK